jgi:hypothetical protein
MIIRYLFGAGYGIVGLLCRDVLPAPKWQLLTACFTFIGLLIAYLGYLPRTRLVQFSSWALHGVVVAGYAGAQYSAARGILELFSWIAVAVALAFMNEKTAVEKAVLAKKR